MPRNPNKIDYSQGFPSFFSAFDLLSDPRTGGNTQHHFGSIIFIVYTCIICGVSKYDLMEEFCESNESWFAKWIDLSNGIPCGNTFARVFEAIKPESFAQCIANHLESIQYQHKPQQIAIDGKALRGTRSSEHRHIHAVSAWACESGITLSQTFVSDKSNEITAIPALLDLLNIEDCVVSIDAMGTQSEIAERIISKKADYLLSVKGNQKLLHEEVKDHFEYALKQLTGKKLDPVNWSIDQTIELSRGRDETRQTLVCHNLDWMQKDIREKWKNLGCIIMVYRHTILEDGSLRSDTSYYMSSLKDTKAPDIQRYIRGHWAIENNCHWVIDTVFKEDANQVTNRNSAKNLSTMRRIVLNALKHAPEISRKKAPASMTKKQLRAAQDTDYREQCLSIVPSV
jgi:predicted transposase YbfD/YdcC